MKRVLVLLAALAALAAPVAAVAHPLGNFTTNRYSEISASGDRLFVLYVLDLAEIPTVQASGELRRLGRDRYGSELAARLARRVSLSVDGEARPLRPLRHRLAFPPGVGGLVTTRLEVVYDAGSIPEEAAGIAYTDGNFSGRLGWREIVIRSDAGARIADSTVPDDTVSERLRVYPKDSLESPLEVTRARASVEPGDGAPVVPAFGAAANAPVRVAPRVDSGFASLISREDVGPGIYLLSLAVAMFWGAAHAFSPGHGKSIVGAYLVGSRSRPRHAFLLGGIVTVTHTLGVFALGLVTLALSEFIVPDELYPWLNLVAALLVVAVGVAVLRVRILDWFRRGPRREQGHRHSHEPHGHEHEGHGHDHAHPHEHEHDHPHDHGHAGHSHVPEPGSGLRGIVAVGVSGGLLPCPTALVVLLAAIQLHRVAYGMLLIVAFSVGLAAVITGIGLLAMSSRRVFRRMSFNGPVVRALPAVSAFVILGLGLVMTVRSIPKLL